MLKEDVELEPIEKQFPCREFQIQQLDIFYSSPEASPPLLVIHGLEATGKVSVTRTVLDAHEATYAFVQCRGCITARHLFEYIIFSCIETLEKSLDISISRTSYARCENLATFAYLLQKLLKDKEHLILVLKDIDKHRDEPATLLPALARLDDIIPNLSVIFIQRVPCPSLLQRTGIPHLHFPSYSREESIQILCTSPPSIIPPSPEETAESVASSDAEEDLWVWSRFCGVVWDTSLRGVRRDVVSFRSVADRLWRPFATPIVDGTYGTRDFSKLLVAKRHLFNTEEPVQDGQISELDDGSVAVGSRVKQDLPYYTKYLLCASYLASCNSAKQDFGIFSRMAEKKRKRRSSGLATKGHRKQFKVTRQSSNASAFSLERLLAIFHALVPHEAPQSIDIYTQLATLSSICLLLPTASATSSADAGSRWRVNFGLDYASALGRSVGIEIADYIIASGT